VHGAPERVKLPAMRSLLRGNETFRKSYVEGARAFLHRLASDKQSPSALYVGCSDSRVIPELLTSSAPGELFVVRNVANLIPPRFHANASVGAAIEYAIEVLCVEHVIVCGHAGCGGVKAILDGHDQYRHLASLHAWLESAAAPILAEKVQQDDHETLWLRAVQANVLAQVDNLRTFPAVSERLREGTLQVHGWVYDLASGGVDVYDPELDRFVTPAVHG
jgi:carbonic anhydrase